jgi:hypothetical protein
VFILGENVKNRAIDVEYLKTRITYCPETGDITHLPKSNSKGNDSWNSRFANKSAGRTRTDGYHLVSIDGIHYLAHVLAYAWMTGALPTGEIDHINMVKNDNRWANLRTATHSENMCNKPLYCNNTSGFKGVNFDKRTSKWWVSIKANKITYYLGVFATIEEAAVVRQKAAERLHGKFQDYETI